MANIVLIGMPGCGKSTVGALLASALHMRFCRYRHCFARAAGEKASGTIIDADRQRRFLKDRRRRASAVLNTINTVIATGGSVVYGKKAMRHLHENGLVVYIRLPYEEIERRLSNLATRGVTLREGQTFRAACTTSASRCMKRKRIIVFDASHEERRRRDNCARIGRSTDLGSLGGKTMSVEIWDLYDSRKGKRPERP